MKILTTVMVASVLVGCSSITRFTDVTNLIDYSDHKSVKLLEIPSDLDSPSFDKTYVTTISDKMAAKKSARLDQVPLVDKNMAAPAASTVKIVKKGSTAQLQLEDSRSIAWKRTNDTLKAMGMTISKADKASGLIVARDRSQVSDARSPIGRFLNKSLGKVNKGAEYQFRVSDNGQQATIDVADKAGKALSESAARLVLSRLRKEYTS